MRWFTFALNRVTELTRANKIIPRWSVFTARCTLVQSAVLRSHVICLSVRLSVTLLDCDHIGWNTSEIISPLVNLRCSLSADSNIMGLFQGEHPKFGPKVTHPLWIWASETFDSKLHAAEWLQLVQWSQWRSYRKLPSLFLMVPSLTPYDLSSPQMGVPYAPKIREWPYLCNGWSDPLHVWFYGRLFRVGGSNGAIYSSKFKFKFKFKLKI